MFCNESNDTSDMFGTVTPSNNFDFEFSKDILSYEATKVIEKIAVCGFTNSFFIIGGPPNILIMIIFYRQGLRDRMNFYLFCLAFVDLLYLASSALRAAYCYIGIVFPDQKDFWKWFFLKYGLCFVYGFGHSSGCVTMIISVERCVCVLFPMKSSSVISTKTMAIILLVTFLVLQLLCSVYFIKDNITVVKNAVTGENIFTLKTTELYLTYPIFTVIENIILPFMTFLHFIVVFLSTVITVVTLRSAIAWRKTTASSYLRGQAVLIRMLVAVSSIYILCTTPAVTLALVRFSVPGFRADGKYGNLFQATHVLFYLPFMVYSSINFIVYVKMSSRFRRELQTLCQCLNKPKAPSISVIISTISHEQSEQ